MVDYQKITLEELTERLMMLGEAKAAYAKAHSGATPFEAYQQSPAVKEQADAIFSGLTYLFVTSIRTNDELIRLQHKSSSHIGWEDIEAIALHGDSQAGHFGGLMGAILTAEADRSPKEMISYCKLRMKGEVMDAFRRRLGRSEASHGKVSHARPLSTFSRGGDEEPSFDVKDTHVVAADNALLDEEYLRHLLQALDALKEPYKTPVQKLLQSSIASGGIDIDGLLEEEGKHDLSRHARGKDKTLRLGLLLLKCAYLNLDDDQLPEVIVNAKRNVQEKRGDWGAYSDAAFAYAKMLGFTLDDMANLVDLTETRIAQLHSQHNISHELLGLLGLAEQKRDALAPRPSLARVKSVPLAYVNTTEASAISGLTRSRVGVRAAHMNPEQDYTPDGRIPEADYKGETVKGKTLVGKLFGSDRWILHVGLVNGWAEAEKKARELAGNGWQGLTKTAEQLDLHEAFLSRRASAIDPKRRYLPDGIVPDAENKGNAVLGSEIVWRHPYDLQQVLLSPRYITGQKEAEKKAQELADSGWQRLFKATEQIGLSISVLSDRAKAINPKRNYLPDGTASDKEHEKNAVPGNELVWRHPYTDKIVFLRPEYVSAQIAAERKIIELKEKGWKNPKDAAENIGIPRTTLHSIIGKILPDKRYLPNGIPLNERENPGAGLPGSDLIYRHPYASRVVLISPAYIQALSQNQKEPHDVKKGGKLELLGTAHTVPAEVAKQLHAQGKKRAI